MHVFGEGAGHLLQRDSIVVIKLRFSVHAGYSLELEVNPTVL